MIEVSVESIIKQRGVSQLLKLADDINSHDYVGWILYLSDSLRLLIERTNPHLINQDDNTLCGFIIHPYGDKLVGYEYHFTQYHEGVNWYRVAKEIHDLKLGIDNRILDKKRDRRGSPKETISI